jgi:hypothetical protein
MIPVDLGVFHFAEVNTRDLSRDYTIGCSVKYERKARTPYLRYAASYG